ncbi:MAG: efflux RND transporter periplasmic adaptor subunit [Acidobacteriaceae bacterium]
MATQPTPPKKKHVWPWLILLLLIGAVFYGAIHRGKQKPSTGSMAFGGPVTLTTTTAKKGDIGVYLNALGTVTALHTVSIASQVTGVVTSVHYREGQLVHKGQPLVDIDPRQYQAQVTEAEGTLERDRGVLSQSRMDLARYQQAWSHNAIPLQTLEDQEKKVAQDEGTVKYDQGVLDYDKVQLGYCHIVAPMDGRVGLRLVDPGNLVTANSSTPLVILTTTNPITVVATISENHLAEVFARPDHGVGLTLEAWNRDDNHKIADGRVSSFDNQIDTTTGTIKLRATYNNSRGELYPNEFVNARLLVKTLKDQILVPDSSIQHNGEESFVYLIQKSAKGLHAVMHDVTTGVSNDGVTAVQGINAGAVLADSSFQKLRNGSEVRVISTLGPAASNASSAQ